MQFPKIGFLLFITSFSALADNVSIPCTFKEGRETTSFSLSGQRDEAGNFASSGYVSDVSVVLNYDRSSGRSLQVSHSGSTYSLSISGSGKITYPPSGIAGMALGAMGMKDSRKLKIVCNPQDMVATRNEQKQESQKPSERMTLEDVLFEGDISTEDKKIEQIITLHTEIKTLGGAKSIRFQNGEIVEIRDLDSRKSHCSIRTDLPVELLPGKITVKSISRVSSSAIVSLAHENGEKFNVICNRLEDEEVSIQKVLDIIGPANMELQKE